MLFCSKLGTGEKGQKFQKEIYGQPLPTAEQNNDKEENIEGKE